MRTGGRWALGVGRTGPGEGWHAWMSCTGLRAERRLCGRWRGAAEANEHRRTREPSVQLPDRRPSEQVQVALFLPPSATNSMDQQQPGGPPRAAATAAVEYSCAGTSSSHPSQLFCSPRRPLSTRADHACCVSRDSLERVDCAANNEIKAREPIRCRECGCRVMYKKRIKRSECAPLACTRRATDCTRLYDDDHVLTVSCAASANPHSSVVSRVSLSWPPTSMLTPCLAPRSNSRHDRHLPIHLLDHLRPTSHKQRAERESKVGKSTVLAGRGGGI
jgi:DNA-directed RNA polymerase subunit RPC12/RpoP